ncbi:MAG: hypothetical protein IPP57_19905 [Candidatus Obscuribacter sp.]|nr:hypothetical protein [Candidatus Obscuribacter sp.]
MPANNNLADSAVPVAASMTIADHTGLQPVRWASMLEASFVPLLANDCGIVWGQGRDWLAAAAVFNLFCTLS